MKVHAVLRSLDSPDVRGPLESYHPQEPAKFGLLVAAHIGPDDDSGEELFYVTVCSPTWIAEATESQNEQGKGFRFIRHHLLLNRWDVELVRRAIGDLCRNTRGTLCVRVQ